MTPAPASSPAPQLRAYRPDLVQRPHGHGPAHLSLVIGGSLREEESGSEQLARRGMFALRPPGFAHQVRFGAGGALIVSMPIPRCEAAPIEPDLFGSWRPAPEPLLRHVLRVSTKQGDGQGVEDSLWDLLSASSPGRDPAPSFWLRRARERLAEDAASIARVAEEAGVHRVHFSRAFTKAFGVPPSVFRRRMCALRAMSAAIEGEAAADTAYRCGFADQSHMARALKEVGGLSFAPLRALGRKVTSVQE